MLLAKVYIIEFYKAANEHKIELCESYDFIIRLHKIKYVLHFYLHVNCSVIII